MIGLRVKQIRKEKSLSQQAFAALLSTASGYISEIENGKTQPGSAFLLSLKRVFDVDINWLLTGGEKIVVAEERPVYGKTDPTTEKIMQCLKGLTEQQKKDVLKYAQMVGVYGEKAKK